MPPAKTTRRKERDLYTMLEEHMALTEECEALCKQALEARRAGNARRAAAIERKARKLMERLLALEQVTRSACSAPPLRKH